MDHESDDKIVVSIHNDDWHTYEQVIAMVIPPPLLLCIPLYHILMY